jgi:hypothetical protein
LYYRLRINGNDNVYLLEKAGYDHIQILNNHLASVVRTILKKHLQPYPDEILYTDDTLKQYQPDLALYKDCYTDLIKKENRIWYLEHGALIAALLYFSLKL